MKPALSTGRVPATASSSLSFFWAWQGQDIQITDLPLAKIDLIAKHIVQDRDKDLRTDRVDGWSATHLKAAACLKPSLTVDGL